MNVEKNLAELNELGKKFPNEVLVRFKTAEDMKRWLTDVCALDGLPSVEGLQRAALFVDAVTNDKNHTNYEYDCAGWTNYQNMHTANREIAKARKSVAE